MIRLEPTSRHPLVIYFLALCAVSSITIGFGAPAPGSVEEALPQWGVYLWAAALFAGSVCVLLGIALQPSTKHAFSGALFEQVGMAMLGAAGILYSIAAIALVGWSGVIPAGLVGGLAAACVYRYLDIRKQLKRYAEAQGATDAGKH